MPRKGAHWEEEEEKCQKEGRRKVHLTGKYRRTRGREGYLLLFSYSSSSSSRCLALAVCWQNLHREGQRGKRGRGLLLRLCVRLTHTLSLRPCSGPTPHLWRYCSPFPLLLFPGWHRREKRIPFLPSFLALPLASTDLPLLLLLPVSSSAPSINLLSPHTPPSLPLLLRDNDIRGGRGRGRMRPRANGRYHPPSAFSYVPPRCIACHGTQKKGAILSRPASEERSGE